MEVGVGGPDGNETYVPARILNKVWRQIEANLPLWQKGFIKTKKVLSFRGENQRRNVTTFIFNLSSH